MAHLRPPPGCVSWIGMFTPAQGNPFGTCTLHMGRRAANCATCHRCACRAPDLPGGAPGRKAARSRSCHWPSRLAPPPTTASPERMPRLVSPEAHAGRHTLMLRPSAGHMLGAALQAACMQACGHHVGTWAPTYVHKHGHPLCEQAGQQSGILNITSVLLAQETATLLGCKHGCKRLQSDEGS